MKHRHKDKKLKHISMLEEELPALEIPLMENYITGFNPIVTHAEFPGSWCYYSNGSKTNSDYSFLNVNQLTEEYGLPYSLDKLPEPGEGGIFIEKKYNIVNSGIATLILVVVVFLVFLSERKQHQLGTDVVPLAMGMGKMKNEDDDIPVVYTENERNK